MSPSLQANTPYCETELYLPTVRFGDIVTGEVTLHTAVVAVHLHFI